MSSFKVNAQRIKKVEIVSDHSIHIIGVNFEGVIFSEKYIDIFIHNGKRFTPDQNDIKTTEGLLSYGLDTIKDE